MNKQDFIDNLRARLSGLPKDDVEERLDFYSEMIEDRIEEGLSEDEAVSAVGSPHEVASQILSEIPLSKIVKEKIKTKRNLHAWEIVLLAVGSPIWLSLLIVAFAVILSLYAVIWSVIVSLWAVFASLIGCAFGGVAAGVIFFIMGNVFSGIATIGAAFVCAGLSIFMFFGCRAATMGAALLTKKIVLGIKNCFVKKGEA